MRQQAYQPSQIPQNQKIASNLLMPKQTSSTQRIHNDDILQEINLVGNKIQKIENNQIFLNNIKLMHQANEKNTNEYIKNVQIHSDSNQQFQSFEPSQRADIDYRRSINQFSQSEISLNQSQNNQQHETVSNNFFNGQNVQASNQMDDRYFETDNSQSSNISKILNKKDIQKHQFDNLIRNTAVKASKEEQYFEKASNSTPLSDIVDIEKFQNHSNILTNKKDIDFEFGVQNQNQIGLNKFYYAKKMSVKKEANKTQISSSQDQSRRSSQQSEFNNSEVGSGLQQQQFNNKRMSSRCASGISLNKKKESKENEDPTSFNYDQFRENRVSQQENQFEQQNRGQGVPSKSKKSKSKKNRNYEAGNQSIQAISSHISEELLMFNENERNLDDSQKSSNMTDEKSLNQHSVKNLKNLQNGTQLSRNYSEKSHSLYVDDDEEDPDEESESSNSKDQNMQEINIGGPYEQDIDEQAAYDIQISSRQISGATSQMNQQYQAKLELQNQQLQLKKQLYNYGQQNMDDQYFFQDSAQNMPLQIQNRSSQVQQNKTQNQELQLNYKQIQQLQYQQVMENSQALNNYADFKQEWQVDQQHLQYESYPPFQQMQPHQSQNNINFYQNVEDQNFQENEDDQIEHARILDQELANFEMNEKALKTQEQFNFNNPYILHYTAYNTMNNSAQQPTGMFQQNNVAMNFQNQNDFPLQQSSSNTDRVSQQFQIQTIDQFQDKKQSRNIDVQNIIMSFNTKNKQNTRNSNISSKSQSNKAAHSSVQLNHKIVDIQSPLTYLVKDKILGGSKFLKQPILSQKYSKLNSRAQRNKIPVQLNRVKPPYQKFDKKKEEQGRNFISNQQNLQQQTDLDVKIINHHPNINIQNDFQQETYFQNNIEQNIPLQSFSSHNPQKSNSQITIGSNRSLRKSKRTYSKGSIKQISEQRNSQASKKADILNDQINNQFTSQSFQAQPQLQNYQNNQQNNQYQIAQQKACQMSFNKDFQNQDFSVPQIISANTQENIAPAYDEYNYNDNYQQQIQQNEMGSNIFQNEYSQQLPQQEQKSVKRKLNRVRRQERQQSSEKNKSKTNSNFQSVDAKQNLDYTYQQPENVEIQNQVNANYLGNLDQYEHFNQNQTQSIQTNTKFFNNDQYQNIYVQNLTKQKSSQQENYPLTRTNEKSFENLKRQDTLGFFNKDNSILSNQLSTVHDQSSSSLALLNKNYLRGKSSEYNSVNCTVSANFTNDDDQNKTLEIQSQIIGKAKMQKQKNEIQNFGNQHEELSSVGGAQFQNNYIDQQNYDKDEQIQYQMTTNNTLIQELENNFQKQLTKSEQMNQSYSRMKQQDRLVQLCLAEQDLQDEIDGNAQQIHHRKSSSELYKKKSNGSNQHNQSYGYENNHYKVSFDKSSNQQSQQMHKKKYSGNFKTLKNEDTKIYQKIDYNFFSPQATSPTLPRIDEKINTRAQRDALTRLSFSQKSQSDILSKKTNKPSMFHSNQKSIDNYQINIGNNRTTAQNNQDINTRNYASHKVDHMRLSYSNGRQSSNNQQYSKNQNSSVKKTGKFRNPSLSNINLKLKNSNQYSICSPQRQLTAYQSFSKTPNAALQTLRSTCSFDPMKKSIIRNHLSHKCKVTNLQLEVKEQKHIIKKHLADRVNQLRTKVIQTQKKAKQVQNDKSLAQESVQDLKKKLAKTSIKVIEVKSLCNHTQNEIQELRKDIEEIEAFKIQLQQELEQEMRFKSDISKIAMKYKKLIQEQKKDKEKISQGLVQQRKIMANSKSRRDILLEDNNKIYDDFSRVVLYDRVRKDQIQKMCQVKLNVSDQNVLNC